MIIIVIYTVCYSFSIDIPIPNDKIRDITIIESFYFSIVTITTLGYGDILPNSNISMLLASSEVLLGILIIGLFVNSLWTSYITKIEATQLKNIEKEISKQNIIKLNTYYQYLEQILKDFRNSYIELTTPLVNRNLNDLKLNNDFKFSDMQDMFQHSIINKYPKDKAVISIYYEILDILIIELKFLLANFDLENNPSIHQVIINLLTWSYARNHKQILLSYKFGYIEEQLKITETAPKLKNGSNHKLYPFTLLETTLKFQIQQVELLLHEFNQLKR